VFSHSIHQNKNISESGTENNHFQISKKEMAFNGIWTLESLSLLPWGLLGIDLIATLKYLTNSVTNKQYINKK